MNCGKINCCRGWRWIFIHYAESTEAVFNLYHKAFHLNSDPIVKWRSGKEKKHVLNLQKFQLVYSVAAGGYHLGCPIILDWNPLMTFPYSAMQLKTASSAPSALKKLLAAL